MKGIAKSRVVRRKGRQTRRATEKLRVAGSQSSINGGGEVVLYEAPDGQIRLDVPLEQATVWLTAGTDGGAVWTRALGITKHIGGVFWGKRPNAKSACAKFAQTAEASWRTATGSKLTSRNPCCLGMGDSLGYAGNHRPEIAPGELLAEQVAPDAKNAYCFKTATLSKWEIVGACDHENEFRKRRRNYRG